MNVLNKNAENIIRNNIKRFGKEIEFKRPKLNKYKEVKNSFEIIVNQKCIYHLASDYSADDSRKSDAGKVQAGKKEMLLTEYNSNIKFDDYCNIGEKLYRISNITNYQQSNKFIDILLEEVQGELNERPGENV